MKTELIKLDGTNDSIKISHAANVLRSGGLVAFPTETVYAIGADARNPEALARLAKVKGKLDGKNYSLLVGSLVQAEQIAGGLSRTARKLARIYWPGALTFVVPRPSGGKVGLRLPEHPIARSLIAQCGFALAAPNATLRKSKGIEPPGATAGSTSIVCDGVTAERVQAAFDGRIELILQAPPAPKGVLSTVVEISDAAVTVQREAAILEVDVLLAAAPTILFVCTGNTCRSPMAAGLCQAAQQNSLMPQAASLRILSAGTNALPGQPAHPYAIAALKELQIDLSGHRSSVLTPDLIDTADWIFTMTRAHLESIIEFMPSCKDRVHMMSGNNDDIAEPIGKSQQRYRQCRDQLAKCLRNVISILEQHDAE